jgi:hypothetical protein
VQFAGAGTSGLFSLIFTEAVKIGIAASSVWVIGSALATLGAARRRARKREQPTQTPAFERADATTFR